ncbi:fumarylacetoacetate hydrolase family protein [Cellulophaga baltica]|uniref:2-keto-4-pentenoate hydratase/2-oxohepta-3-ene-1,7-dioic acid hydratase (Catechol pathway) n=2 Tax=Cellulophaga baltica TaxID=76594 RepID=A0A1G7JDG1_9FLAO|nr:fumarylacetoacetate hydrolase family protein [Cellulophaga baltica]AIY13427.1 2-hydroxyhepta-2,4-diene-1,7-dioate isomerase [Cellulophaga baltica NN016038]AIZ41778.1 2-hydroxyhepta-2,4-diene-1,7-dioate isomerase [Cellulophaga baltica 18]MBA6316179.1 fumarylacetoacetate hydrolase family protein [Cellulophaga baltica]SDF22936.1 2-keto-4-pentenoate hydratase/2-oxohepta-3-ene-1,7-dioic acid hydratase (catechol pathway) [Cellulophaga baltica]
MKIICIGRNYTAHIAELQNEKPKDPVVFIKPDSSVLPKEQDFYIPEFSNDIHYEVEVLVKIKKVGKHISEKFAPNYYDEVGLGIDFTARDVQQALKEKGLPWEKAKGFDGATVIGNWVPKEKFESIDNLGFQLLKNDEVVQDGNTNLMLWKIDELIAYVSTFFTLKKGDVIFTGTPAGVGSVKTNDYLSGRLEGIEMFNVTIK